MERDLLFIFYAFGAVWLIVAAYVIHLGLRESRVQRQLDNVKRMVETQEKS